MIIAVLFVSFFILLLIGAPISYGIIISSFLVLFLSLPASAAYTASQTIFAGLNSFPLMAIPFFVFAGNVMNSGGIAVRLINFAKMLGGGMPGYVSQVNIFGNMLFGAISGSGTASAVAIGGITDEMGRKEGYPDDFRAAVNTASCPTGLLIPPSNILVIYSLASGGVSIAALFVAGYIPGIIMGLMVSIVAFIIAKKNKYPVSDQTYTLKDRFTIFLKAFPSLFLIFIIMFGIVKGIFTPTEGGAIAVIYTLILSLFYKGITIKSLTKVFIDSTITCGMILFIVSVSGIMSWAMSFEQIPQMISNALISFSDNKYVILLLVNVLFLIIGTFMDMSPAVLIFTPIFMPLLAKYNIDPIHFGIIMVFNLSVGLMTPPVGNALFICSTIAKAKIEEVIKRMIPFFFTLFIGLMLVTYIPAFSLILPKLFGFIK